MNKAVGGVIISLGCILFFTGLGIAVVAHGLWIGYVLLVIGVVLVVAGIRLYQKWRWVPEDEGGSFGPDGKRRYREINEID